MAEVDYDALIPNNVGLADDPRVQRALEAWHPGYLDWWMDMGPDGFQEAEVWLRTAISVEKSGWAKFGFVRMPEYRWGILLAPAQVGRTIPFGDHRGEPAWQDVPGDYRSLLRRIIVIQGDTEPASVEQQRFLGKSSPSLYDLRNLFQVNVEEGRHLWAMVYLLHKYFGRDGRDEAAELLQRRSGNDDRPRLLGAFNEETPDWLSFFLFTFFTDRDGKMQLEALAQSGFDPLSRTCRFMLAEEAHHMYVGVSGVSRIVRRTAEAMEMAGITDPYDAEAIRGLGVIDLPTIQRKINLHFSLTLDLFGSEQSSNAATFFTTGLKGRFHEDRLEDDHQLHEATYPVLEVGNGSFEAVEAPALRALNARLRDDFVEDCRGGLGRWNRAIAEHGIEFELELPHIAFHRQIGGFSALHVSPDGRILGEDEWEVQRSQWLPTSGDAAFITELMQPVHQLGEFASWIAPPSRGISQKPVDFEYVKLPE
jgi:benzoyl-CoA 2,3-dioxygenase component B